MSTALRILASFFFIPPLVSTNQRAAPPSEINKYVKYYDIGLFGSLTKEEANQIAAEFMKDALALVNAGQSGIVSIRNTFGSNFVLKIALPGGEEFNIDIVSPEIQSEEGIFLKQMPDFVEEIKQKIALHLEALQTKGILVSDSGSKFDTRMLRLHSCSIDPQGYLLIDGNKVVYVNPESVFLIKAAELRNSAIIRLFEDGEYIYLDTGARRPDQIGMRIGLQKTISFQGEECYVFDRPYLSLEEIERLGLKLQGWPKP